MSAIANRAAAGFTAGVVMTAGIVAITGISWSADVAPVLFGAAPAPAPAPALAPAPAPTPTPARQALSPTLDSTVSLRLDCFDFAHCEGVTASGLPAISPDRKTIATLWSSADGGRGNPNFHVRFSRAGDGAVIDEVTILEASEISVDEPPPASTIAALESLARRRIDRAMTRLRRDRFEPLIQLSSSRPELRARYLDLEIDVARETVVARDRETGWVRLQATYPLDQPAEPDPDDPCAVLAPRAQALYLSVDGATLVSAVTYDPGPCWCDLETRLYASALAEVPRNIRQRSR